MVVAGVIGELDGHSKIGSAIEDSVIRGGRVVIVGRVVFFTAVSALLASCSKSRTTLKTGSKTDALSDAMFDV